MWRYLECSVTGPSHVAAARPCQDRSAIRLTGSDPPAHLIACVADGAGSAEFGGDGAEIACRVMADCAELQLNRQPDLAAIEHRHIVEWCEQAREHIRAEVAVRDSTARQFATTLCAAIVAPRQALFFQIGDGAIVLRRNGVLGTVFWPQSGEFANSTNFLTADNYRRHLAIHHYTGSVEELALLTDGMERMSLNFERRTPHPPFFQPIFQALHQTTDMQRLRDEMRQFLLSDPVRVRSNDDKTIIIATRDTDHTEAR